MNSEWVVGQHVRSDYQVSIDSFIRIFSSFAKRITPCISTKYIHRLFRKTVSSYNELINALGTSGVPAKFTGVNVALGGITATAAVSTEKKVYLAGSLTLNEASTLNGDVVVTKDATLTTTKATTISAVTVNSGVTLTIGENSNITVTGNITNNGTYAHATGAVVYCAGIDGNGTWTNYPTF